MSKSDLNFTIGLVGAGNMGSAMLRGWLKNGFEPANVSVFDPSPPAAITEFLGDQGISAFETASDGRPVDVLILAVKPQIMENVLPTLDVLIGPDTVIVSVAAGTTIGTISATLGEIACVRVMPNTPALVGEGMSVGFANSLVTQRHRQWIDLLMAAVGKFAWVDHEQHIDAVTAVSGSGPAYVFHLAECMAKAGAAAGLDDELAMMLSKQTILGAGVLMENSEDTPATLRQNVTSPNGTTAAALSVLMEEQRMEKLIGKAISAAKRRSEELSG